MPSAPSVAAIGRPLVCAPSPGRGTVIVSPDRHFFAAQSASGRRELIEAQCLVICVGLLIPLCDAIRTRNQSEEVTRRTMVTPFGNATATLELRVLFQHGLMTEFHPPMA